MRLAIAFVTLVGFTIPAQAITNGQVDTFSAGAAFWSGGSVLPDGGPAGSGDAHLRMTNTGVPGYLLFVNRMQWSGDYSGAGIARVQADLANVGPSQLSIRLGFGSESDGSFRSTQPYLLPPDNSWHHASFGLTNSDLTWTGTGTGDLSAALASAMSLSFSHSPGSPLDGLTPVLGSLGIDNITALPEPTSCTLLLVFGALALSRKRSEPENTK